MQTESDKDAAKHVGASVTRVDGAARSLRLHQDEWLPLAERNLTLAETAFASGTLDLDGLLEAQATLLDTRAARIGLQLEAATALADLESAVGRRLE